MYHRANPNSTNWTNSTYYPVQRFLGDVNDDGTVADKRVVGESDSVMYRAGVDRWHTVIPVTDFVVYHESKPGPYLRNRDSVFPHWAPDSLDPKESRRYMDHLLALAEDGK